jgi:hypothetical protein
VPTPPRPPGRPGLQGPSKPDLDPLAKSKREKEELAGDVVRLEEEIEELKVRYEMYFLGNERREPVHQREDLKKKVLRAKEGFTRNAALRFRIQSLHARFLSYERMWLRSAREKEDGTYRRDLFKARLHARGKAPIGPAAGAAAKTDPSSVQPERSAQTSSSVHPERSAPAGRAESRDAPPSDSLAAAVEAAAAGAASPTVKPASAAPKAAAKPTRPAARAPGGKLAETEMRALYDQYVAAKRRCHEDVSKLSYEAVARSVAKQVPELMAKHHASSVDFKVVVKDGKAVLKAIPRT